MGFSESTHLTDLELSQEWACLIQDGRLIATCNILELESHLLLFLFLLTTDERTMLHCLAIFNKDSETQPQLHLTFEGETDKWSILLRQERR